ncbi:MAG: ABC transporter permease [Pyrinomonadaceae bacterium]
MDSLVISNIRQRPLRSLVSVLGVALGVALVMLFTGLARGMSNDLQRRSANVRAEITFTRQGSAAMMTSATANVSTQYVAKIKAIEGVAEAVPVLVDVTTGKGGLGFERLEGLDWDSFAAMNGIGIVRGRAPQAADEIVIDETRARNYRLDVGSVVPLFGNQPYRVAGVFAPESGARIKMTLSALQDAIGTPGKCTFILVKCHHPEDQLEVARRIEAALPGNKIQLTRDITATVEKSIPYLGVFLRTLVVLSAIVSTLVIMLAMYTTITERTREIGILKAMGASRGYIIGVIEKEAIVISLIGLVFGFALSLAAGYLIHSLYGLFFEYGWAWALAAAVIGLAGGALGALYPAMRAANLDPVQALAHE